MKHVWFYVLPVGAKFTHKDCHYEKSGEESAIDLVTGKEHTFEIHYGCVVDDEQFKDLCLDKEALRPMG